MGDRYAVGLTQTAVSSVTGATATDAVGTLESGVTTHRPRVYDLLFSHGTTPADNVVRWQVMRITASGTGTGATENALDDDAPASSVVSEEEINTAGPTVTANSELLDFDLNQRATFRWVAAPGGEIVMPATAAYGLVFNCSSGAYSGIARCTAHWEE